MTRDELLAKLVAERAVFDSLAGAVPPELIGTIPEGHSHSPRDIVVHVNAYEQLITERLRAAREGKTTEFDRDRDSWQAFNDRIWAEATVTHSGAEAGTVLHRSRDVFGDLLDEARHLTDAELNEVSGITEHIDPHWLDGRSLAELIAIDAYDHYGMHRAALEAAAGVSGASEPEAE